jgi:hypothetical protein
MGRMYAMELLYASVLGAELIHDEMFSILLFYCAGVA